LVQAAQHALALRAPVLLGFSNMQNGELSLIMQLQVRGASKIKLKKVNKKRTVTVKRVIIFLYISRHPLLICLQCCLHQYKSPKAMATATAAIILLTICQEFKEGFFGISSGLPLV
jgi:hypothetical protein